MAESLFDTSVSHGTLDADDTWSGADEDDARELTLELRVTDPEVLAALRGCADPRARAAFASAALRIGVLALRQAEGSLDADAIRRAGSELMADLERRLSGHQQAVSLQVSGELRRYFDPESGHFHERVERLVRRDGELEALLRRQLDAEDSALARTLAQHVGEGSPLLQRLDPRASDGLLRTLEEQVGRALGDQRERFLREFSLDNPEGALARLVGELATQHGRVGESLEARIDEVVSEFSLDEENSALSRLVRRVETAQQQISSELSLDAEGSGLARMQRELLSVLERDREDARHFREEVVATLATLRTRREEHARSPRHGEEFERALLDFVNAESQRCGDVCSHVGNETGLIRQCKVGDLLVELGPESAAAGARLVVEAKESAGYDLRRALAEIERGRKNRGAEIGLFVFSSRAAPAGLEPFARFGQDLVVIWDAEDPTSDVGLRAALSVGRALATRSSAGREERAADFEAIERSVREVEKQARSLEEIDKVARTIRGGADKILSRSRIARESLGREVERLEQRVDDLRALAGEDSGA